MKFDNFGNGSNNLLSLSNESSKLLMIHSGISSTTPASNKSFQNYNSNNSFGQQQLQLHSGNSFDNYSPPPLSPLSQQPPPLSPQYQQPFNPFQDQSVSQLQQQQQSPQFQNINSPHQPQTIQNQQLNLINNFFGKLKRGREIEDCKIKPTKQLVNTINLIEYNNNQQHQLQQHQQHTKQDKKSKKIKTIYSNNNINNNIINGNIPNNISNNINNNIINNISINNNINDVPVFGINGFNSGAHIKSTNINNLTTINQNVNSNNINVNNSLNNNNNNNNNNNAASVPEGCNLPFCTVCEKGIPPSFENQKPIWSHIIYVALYSLNISYEKLEIQKDDSLKCKRSTNGKRFFRLDKDIFQFIENHWHQICFKERQSNWRHIAGMTLSHYPMLFENGYKVFNCTGYWGLSNYNVNPYSVNFFF